eukprot:TRINITY_DN3047_c0_g2_i6.p1 TRINITY_DN3047_c0_g2~~TRINITY_DN3047_c0_g2_i6.p1  ORF type:complete len:289 (-),score=64.66 TRINITY_DN3047_c0_g2_i6:72-938(-)
MSLMLENNFEMLLNEGVKGEIEYENGGDLWENMPIDVMTKAIQKEEEEQVRNKCKICFGEIRERSTIDCCDDEFCQDCILLWSKMQSKCPKCFLEFRMIVVEGIMIPVMKKETMFGEKKEERLQPILEDMISVNAKKREEERNERMKRKIEEKKREEDNEERKKREKEQEESEKRRRRKAIERIETTPKPFPCNVGKCEKRFETMFGLDGHHAKVHGWKRVHCSRCAKSFKKKEELEEHLMMHARGVKENHCKVCTSSFSAKSSLIRHMLKIHKIDQRKGWNQTTLNV